MKLLAVDGNSIINRAYYGVRPLTTSDGRFTNAIFGFTSIMLKMLADVKPDAVAVAFDLHAPTFRHKMYAEYKAGRHKTPDELLSQFEPIRKLIRLWGFTDVDAAGFEADDILGTLAAACRAQGAECVIATGDRDSLQLITDGVCVRLAKTSGTKADNELLDTAAIVERYGVQPHQLIDVKAIMGDSSDNIPGVTGIGEKGALSLISMFGSLDGVYDNLDDSRIKPGLRDKLVIGKEQAYFSRVLAEIVTNAAVSTNITDYLIRPADSAKLRAFLTEYELFSVIGKLPCEEKNDPSVVGDAVAVALVDRIDAPVAFTLVKDSAVLCDALGNCCVRPAEEILNYSGLVTDCAKLAAERVGASNATVAFDVCLAAYLINPSATDYSAARLAEEYNVAPRVCDCADADVAAAAATVAILPELRDITLAKLTEYGMDKLYYDIELPLAWVLASMEREGFCVDFAALEAFACELKQQLSETEQNIYLYANTTFNINSPKQLGEVLFSQEHLNLPSPKMTQRGYSTDAETLDKLRLMHPIIDEILRYRKYSKLLSTYCDGLKRARGEDGRIHSTYNQTETRTGRISSSEPNLQNIPVRTELGREMRKFFTAREGWLLVDADYSQIELRVLAHLSQDAQMCAAFCDNADIHARTASEIFGLPAEFVTPEMRSRAKTVNFGIVYGISAFSLAGDLHISQKEAKSYIDGYLRTFRGVSEYMENCISAAKESGVTRTMFNRRRLLPELKASNFATRSFGERVARNAPIQGTAADIIKLAMVRVYERLRREGYAAKLILQVHDELIVEAPENEAERVRELLRDEMEHAVSLSVPLIADAHIGKTWFDAK